MMRAWRALPTLVRIGFAETLAYRAEFIVWVFTMTLPLVMLALWTTVASEGPFRGFSSERFIAYYLVTLIVRQLTSQWVAWQLNMEVKHGSLSMRLLRPIHPFVTFASQQLAALPLRMALALPVAIMLLFTRGADVVVDDPATILAFGVALLLAWLVTFALMMALGSLALYFTNATSALDVYFGLFAVLSGYTLPVELLPSWLAQLANFTPFPSVLANPVAILTNPALDGRAIATILATQAGWAIAMLGVALLVWRGGVRRFEAVGG